MKTKSKYTLNEYIKANRKGSREAELELSPGWVSKHKIHKSKKQYNRKRQDWKTDLASFIFHRIFISQQL